MLVFALSRRVAALGVLVASLGTLGWLWFGASDEQRILSVLNELAHAVSSKQGESLPFRAARLKSVFEDHLEPDVTLDSHELKRARGTAALVELAAAAPRFYGDFEIAIDEVDVELVEGASQARASARATLTAAGEGRRDERRVTFYLTKSSGDWRVSGIQVARKTDD